MKHEDTFLRKNTPSNHQNGHPAWRMYCALLKCSHQSLCMLASKNSCHCYIIPLIQGVHRFSAPWESNLRPWWRAAVSNLLEKYRRGRQVGAWLFQSYSMTLTTNNLSLMTLPCCHSFHDACVIAWLSKAANCPLCRLNSRRLKFLQHNHTLSHI